MKLQKEINENEILVQYEVKVICNMEEKDDYWNSFLGNKRRQ